MILPESGAQIPGLISSDKIDRFNGKWMVGLLDVCDLRYFNELCLFCHSILLPPLHPGRRGSDGAGAFGIRCGAGALM